MSKKDYYKWLYTSFKGRIGRKTFLLYFFLPFILLAVFAPNVPFHEMTIKDLILTVVMIVVILPCYCAGMAKRLHDRGQSGWWMLIAFIPLIGFLYTLIVMGILKGDETSNEYGEPEVIKNA